MRENNPLVIPRNHNVEKSLDAACNDDNLQPFNKLIKYLKNPYIDQNGISKYQTPPEANGKTYKTFCGT